MYFQDRKRKYLKPESTASSAFVISGITHGVNGERRHRRQKRRERRQRFTENDDIFRRFDGFVVDLSTKNGSGQRDLQTKQPT
jgi:hypothetical protein